MMDINTVAVVNLDTTKDSMSITTYVSKLATHFFCHPSPLPRISFDLRQTPVSNTAKTAKDPSLKKQLKNHRTVNSQLLIPGGYAITNYQY